MAGNLLESTFISDLDLILFYSSLGRLAQLVEQLTLNQQVEGSSPSSLIQKRGFSENSDESLLKSCFSDPKLKQVIEAWPKLSAELRSAIIKMIK